MTETKSNSGQPARHLPLAEFIPLLALVSGLDALSIDGMLPALAQIGRDLHVETANNVQLVISAMFLGIVIGQLVGGPASDSFGRRRTMLIGLAVYLAGCLVSVTSISLPVMLGGRVLQGLGASAAMVTTTAIIRDLYSGAPMARLMSFIGSVFILVPIIAPLLGQGILLIGHWRLIFGMFAALALFSGTWFWLRQDETLPFQRRAPFTFSGVARAAWSVCTNRSAIGYTLAMGLVFGAFIGYLSSTQQIFQDTYQAANSFVLYFAVLSACIGSAFIFNGVLVIRLGMRRLVTLALIALTLLSLGFLLAAFGWSGRPPIALLMAYLGVSFFCVGILFGNLNALAMEPLGATAGIGAAIVGGLSTAISLPVGTLIGQMYDGTVIPLVAGFAIAAPLTLAICRWTDASRPISTPGSPQSDLPG